MKKSKYKKIIRNLMQDIRNLRLDNECFSFLIESVNKENSRLNSENQHLKLIEDPEILEMLMPSVMNDIKADEIYSKNPIEPHKYKYIRHPDRLFD